jgi:hypothetical protein
MFAIILAGLLATPAAQVAYQRDTAFLRYASARTGGLIRVPVARDTVGAGGAGSAVSGGASPNFVSGYLVVGQSYSDPLAEIVAYNASAAAEMHAVTGSTAGYAGFGARNNRDVSAGVTLAGWAGQAYSSSSASTLAGYPLADMAVTWGFGANSAGHMVGTDTGPLVLFTTDDAGGTGGNPRLHFAPSCKTITDNVLTAFVQVNIPSGSLSGGTISYTVWAIDASNFQSRSGIVPWSGVNRAGTETCGISSAGTDTPANETGTITAAFTQSNSPTNGCLFSVTSDTSLTTPTAMAICYSVGKNAGAGRVVEQ